MTTEKYRDAIVYVWAKREEYNIGGRTLDSSYDTYDREYGWTIDDHRRASGGTNFSLYTVTIGIVSLNTKKNIDITVRLDKAITIGISWERPVNVEAIKRKAGSSMVLDTRGDNVVLYKSGERLLDIGSYGIFDTLTGRKLHNSPNEKAKEITRIGDEVFFKMDWSTDSPIFSINLEQGLKRGGFYNKMVPKNAKGIKLIKRDMQAGPKHYFEPFTFKVDGKKCIVDNRLRDDVPSFRLPRIIDDNQNAVLEGNSFLKYFVDAVGFPEDILLEKFPKLKGD